MGGERVHEDEADSRREMSGGVLLDASLRLTEGDSETGEGIGERERRCLGAEAAMEVEEEDEDEAERLRSDGGVREGMDWRVKWSGCE